MSTGVLNISSAETCERSADSAVDCPVPDRDDRTDCQLRIAGSEAPSEGLFCTLKLFDLSLRFTSTPLLRGFSFIEHRNGLGFHNRNDSEFFGTNRS